MTALKYTYKHIGTVVIDSVPDEHEEIRDYELSFWWNNRRYYLSDFVRVHNNPWIYDDFPEVICGMESDNYSKHCLFIGCPGGVLEEGYKLWLFEEVEC